MEGFNEVSCFTCKRHGRSGSVRIPFQLVVYGEYWIGSGSNVVHVHVANLVNDMMHAVSIKGKDVVDVVNAADAGIVLVVASGDGEGVHVFYDKEESGTVSIL